MNRTFLEIVTEKARARVALTRSNSDIEPLRKAARNVRSQAKPFRLQRSFCRTSSANIIAEIKRGSPSKGMIDADVDIVRLASEYEAGGAAAISVLTEEEYFYGSLDDLRAIRSAVTVPILRKDFIVDEIQILEAAVAGADAILLIVAALSPTELRSLIRFTHEWAMDALVEVHSTDEMTLAAEQGATIIGINNRDLHSLEVSLDVCRRLVSVRPEGTLIVAESGISTRDEIKELRQIGFNGFLIGEALMRDADPRGTLESWI